MTTLPMTTRSLAIQATFPEASEWRRLLHETPQTRYEETVATQLVCRKLSEWGIPYESEIAGTGIVATVEGRQNHSGRVVAFRADMDALNITEQSGRPWSSKIAGKMHACGHDGHTATLLMLARYLQETRNFDGLIRLIFQPDEEGGGGAFLMLKEGLLNRFPFDEIYGYHNWPTLPRGKFAICPGPMMAAADVFEIRLVGTGGHAAMPHLTRDVIPAASQLVLAIQTLVSRDVDPKMPVVVSVTNMNAGSGANNVIGDLAQLSGTVRTLDSGSRSVIRERMQKLTSGVADAFGLGCEIRYERLVDATINELGATAHCRAAAARVVGKGNVLQQDPVMGGEDFSGFLEVRPGAFMLIGQGETDPSSPCNQCLHSPFYDFNDAILPSAVEYFAELAESRLPIQREFTSEYSSC